MENDAPVVGPDAPTANSKIVKLDVGTADLSPPTSGLRVIRPWAMRVRCGKKQETGAAPAMKSMPHGCFV